MGRKTRTITLLALLLGLVAVPAALAIAPRTVQPIYDGPDLDYQPSIIRRSDNGDLMVVFERINLGNFFGDFYAAFSSDDGETWSLPQPIIDSPRNERHPSLLQLAPDSFVLFYLVDETGGGSYRLHRATSSDGQNWTDQGIIDLGWPTPGEINPNVIREAGGTLTMTYHRLYGPSYIAQSSDEGVTWDTLQTQVSPGNAQLPRLAKRESDGLYIVTYQVGGSNLDLFAKISYDPYDWSGPEIPISTDINTHDSQPIVLEDGTFLVTYAKTTPGPFFDVYYRTSCDGQNWQPQVRVTYEPNYYDTQPHPLLHGTLGHIILTWPHQDSPSPYEDHDVWINTDLVVPADVSNSLKEVQPAFFQPADPLTYTLLLSNEGHGPTQAWLSDTIPPSTTYEPGSLWASSGEYGYDPGSQVITWAGRLSTCSRITITFRVNSDPGLAAGDLITNTAWLTEAQGSSFDLVAVAQQCDPVQILTVTRAISDCQVTFGADLIGSEPIDYLWDFYAFGSSTKTNPLVDFGASGTFSYTLAVSNCQGVFTDSYAGAITVYCCDPVHGAGFSWVPDPPMVGQEVTFSGTTSGTQPITFSWDLGDGNEAGGATITHTYALAGNYLVVMTAANGCGLEVISQTVSVVESPCDPVHSADFGWAPITPTVGEVVSFTGTAAGGAPIGYQWDFGDGGVGSGTVVTHTYTGPGIYAAVMTATNCQTATATVIHNVSVVEPLCEAAQIITWTTVISGCVVGFQADVTGTVPFSWQWAFGDGMTSTQAMPVHDYGVSGSYTVTLQVWNCSGQGSDERSFVVEVTCPPTWEFYLVVVFKHDGQ